MSGRALAKNGTMSRSWSRGALIEFGGWTCPLTPIENALRARAGEAGYAGGFIQHYVLRALYPSGLTPGIRLTLGALVVVVN